MVFFSIFSYDISNFNYTEAKKDLGSEEKTEETDRMKKEAHT